jgi:hypothetical protein
MIDNVIEIRQKKANNSTNPERQIHKIKPPLRDGYEHKKANKECDMDGYRFLHTLVHYKSKQKDNQADTKKLPSSICS